MLIPSAAANRDCDSPTDFRSFATLGSRNSGRRLTAPATALTRRFRDTGFELPAG